MDIQNENLIARLYSEGSDEGRVEAVVPDLISVVDIESCKPILCEDLKYGLRVSVIVLPCSPIISTPQALKVCGPAAFGYLDVKYTPLGGHSDIIPLSHT